MKILIISQYYKPEQFLINEIAPQLVANGHNVTVLTGLPNYPEGIVHAEYRNGMRRQENIDGVHVIRCYEHGRGKGRMNLIFNYLSFALATSWQVCKMSGFDIIFCYQLSPVTMLLPAVIGKRKFKIPLLTYCLDLWPESARAMAGSGFVYKLIARGAKFLYQQCDKIAVTSRPFLKYFNHINNIPQERLCYIPQHAADDMLNLDLTAENNSIADFMFAGNLGKGQKIEVIIKAAERLRERDDFKIHLVGDGSMRNELEVLVKEIGISDKIIFHGNQPREKMSEWYKKADVLLITLRGDNFVGHTMPGKLQTYMTTGKPILGAINGAAAEVIMESGCGKCVAAEDDAGLATLMLDYLEHPEQFQKCGQMGKEYFKDNFTLDIFMNRLNSELQQCV